MLDAQPPAKELLGDRGYDANGVREGLVGLGIAATVIFWIDQCGLS